MACTVAAASDDAFLLAQIAMMEVATSAKSATAVAMVVGTTEARVRPVHALLACAEAT